MSLSPVSCGGFFVVVVVCFGFYRLPDLFSLSFFSHLPLSRCLLNLKTVPGDRGHGLGCMVMRSVLC